MERIAPRGTGNASLVGATEGLVLLAAAVEAILVTGLALRIGGVGTGSATVASFSRLNDLLLSPAVVLIGTAPGFGASLAQQCVAILGYGLFFLVCIGMISWLDRRRLFS